MLKSAFFVVVALFSTQAFAAFPGPVLSYRMSSGFVPPEFRHSIQCDITSNRVVIKSFNARTGNRVQTRAIRLPDSVYGLIQDAAKTPITQQVGPVDGPIWSYTATMILPNDALATVQLGSDNGNGIRASNSSPAAQQLIKIINAYCKK